mgnify:CR=1 FL=1
MRELSNREINQRSALFCQFNGKKQPIPVQLSVFDSLCDNEIYIAPDDTGELS